MIDFLGDIFSSLLYLIGDGLLYILEFLFGWINLPSFPEGLSNSINVFLNLIFDNLSLLSFFVRGSTLKLVVPILIILINFEFIYKMVIWIARKIPFLNVH